MLCYKRILGFTFLVLGAGMLLVIFLPKLGWVLFAGLLLVILGWAWLMY